MHTPPVRVSELVKYHAVLANGSHWMAASVVRGALLTVMGVMLDGRTIGESNSGGIIN